MQEPGVTLSAMLTFTVAGRTVRIDWVHAFQILLTIAIVILTWELTPEAQGLTVKIPVATATSILGLLGLLWRSVFHTNPPAPGGLAGGGGPGSRLADTPRDGQLPVDRSVRAAMAPRKPWPAVERIQRRDVIFRGIMLAPLALLLRCLPPSVAPTLQSIQGWLGYVTTFVQGAQALWAVILPLLGAKGPQDNEVFQSAIRDVTNGQAAIDEALQAAEAAAQPTPDLSTMIASIQAAVARVVALIDAFETPTPVLDGGPPDGGAMIAALTKSGALVTSDTLRHHATIIRAYKQPRRA